MNLKPETQQLITAYIDEVGVNLPKKMRTDIGVEIQSLVMDALEDKVEMTGEYPSEALILDTLRELGSPLDVAAAYHPHNYVIGPKMFASFWLTVRGALIVMGIIFLLGLFTSVFQLDSISIEHILSTIGEIGSNFWDSALQTFAIIVLVFIVLERTIPDQDWVGQLKAWSALAEVPFFRQIFGRTTASGGWDPEIWADTPKSERVPRGETIFGVVVIIFVAMLVNFFPHKVGIYGFHNGESWFVPLLAPIYTTYLIGWNIYWLFALGLSFILLALGRWTRLTRWIEFGLLIFSGILVYWMLNGPPVLGLNPFFLSLYESNSQVIAQIENGLLPTLRAGLNVFLVLHLIGKGIHIIIKLIRLLRKPPDLLPVFQK